jgi:hypothetical protein
MDGTQPPNDKIVREPPSPLVAELEGRLRDIGRNGAEPWNDPVEKRREARRRDLEIMRAVSVEAAVRLTEAMAGRIPSWECPLFQDIKDPIGALAKLNRSIIQLVLAEEQLDETVAERTARIVAEAEARMKAERDAAARHDYTQSQIRRSENRRQVQHAVCEITLAEYRLLPSERERMLTKLFADLDKDANRFEHDPALVIADVASRLGLTPTLSPADKHRLAKRREQRVAVARDHLEALRGEHPIDDDRDSDDESSSAPPTRAHGPPH